MDYTKKHLPDSTQWVRHYSEIAKGSNTMDGHWRKHVQKGGALRNGFTSTMNSFDTSSSKDMVSPEIISPAKQITNQARSEIDRLSDEKRSVKRKKTKKSGSVNQKRRRVHNSRTKKIVNKKTISKKKKKKPQKKELHLRISSTKITWLQHFTKFNLVNCLYWNCLDIRPPWKKLRSNKYVQFHK